MVCAMLYELFALRVCAVFVCGSSVFVYFVNENGGMVYFVCV